MNRETNLSDHLKKPIENSPICFKVHLDSVLKLKRVFWSYLPR